MQSHAYGWRGTTGFRQRSASLWWRGDVVLGGAPTLFWWRSAIGFPPQRKVLGGAATWFWVAQRFSAAMPVAAPLARL